MNDNHLDRPGGGIRAMLFDADGVVIFPWGFRLYLETVHGITPQMTHEFFHGPFEDCLTGKADLCEVLPPYLECWGWPGTLDDFLSEWFETDGVVDQRVLEAIGRVRRTGTLCCLASSQERYRATHLARVMGFAHFFDWLFFSHSLGYAKPDPAFFHSIESMLGLPPEAILFWDDFPENVEAARRCGWHAEVYSDFEHFAPVLAGYLEHGEAHATG
jgi:putative hydrolase of the HAD superfamily